MAVILLYAGLAVLLYTYCLFPLLVVLRRLVFRRPVKAADIEPHVSLLIACHNEGRSIGAKLDNVLALDYPRDRLQVIVASDGSTDETEAVAARYAERGVMLLRLPRRGKAPALNAAVAAATGEVLVFSDANSMYAADAIRRLVRPLADPGVGGVAGNQCYLPSDTAATSAGERGYWSFDRLLKWAESRAGNTISATGAIYAIRRSLFLPVPGGVTDDFVTSTRVIAQGYRLVFEPTAIAYEPPAASSRAEFRRKVRVITRGLRGVLWMRCLLNPLQHGFYALQLFSHKVLRRLAAAPLLVVLIASACLWQQGPVYQAALAGQLVFYGLAAVGWASGETGPGRWKVFSVPFFFCLVNAAAAVAVVNLLRGHRIELWEPQHEASGDTAARPQISAVGQEALS